MIIWAINPKYQERAIQWMQASALLALCCGILLPKIFPDQIAVALISGILLGYSVVGNLFSLYHRTHRDKKTS